MSKPLILVHGAWHGAWCFAPLISSLHDHGIDPITIDLPLKGSKTDIATTRSLIAKYPEAVVLGHSYGGVVITHAAIGMNVVHLVYLCAFLPDKEEDLYSRFLHHSDSLLHRENTLKFNDDGTTFVNPSMAYETFYHDCDTNDAEHAIAQLRNQPVDTFPLLTQTPAWKETPSTYVICNQDKAIPPSLQREFARSTTNSIEIDSGHSPFMSMPDKVAEILVQLVR